jgi:hypothetical protein
MSESYSGPPARELRKTLRWLVTQGLTPDNLVRRGGDLLNLRVVVSRVQVGADASEDEWERAAAAAFVDVLVELTTNPRGEPGVIYVFKSEHRKVLRNVLSLKPELVGAPLEQRRKAAAEELGLEVSTARTSYEPPALDDLVRALIELDARHRGEDPPPSLR